MTRSQMRITRSLAAAFAEIAIDPGLPRHEVKIVGFCVRRAALLDRLLLFRQQLDLQGIDDRLR